MVLLKLIILELLLITPFLLLSIVAVHGLGGDLRKTWTHPTSKAFWLKDFLPKQIPDARIMTFGYNANAAFGQSTAEVVDHAKSLLVSLLDKRENSEVLRYLNTQYRRC